MHFIERTVARETDDFRFALDVWELGVVVHFIFKTNITPRILRQIDHEWKLFRQCVTCPLYAVEPPDGGRTWAHFITRFGFRAYSTVRCNNEEERALFIHTVQ